MDGVTASVSCACENVLVSSVRMSFTLVGGHQYGIIDG